MQTKLVKTLSILIFLLLLSVLPFCFYMEYIGAEWLKKQWEVGNEIKHEGMEIILIFAFGIYSIPFLIWTIFIYRKPYLKRVWELVVIFLFAVTPGFFWKYYFTIFSVNTFNDIET